MNASLLLVLLSAVCCPVLAEEPGDPETDSSASTRATEADALEEPALRKPRKTEGLVRPGSDKLNPEASQPALLNPCRAEPQPRWCAE